MAVLGCAVKKNQIQAIYSKLTTKRQIMVVPKKATISHLPKVMIMSRMT